MPPPADALAIQQAKLGEGGRVAKSNGNLLPHWPPSGWPLRCPGKGGRTREVHSGSASPPGGVGARAVRTGGVLPAPSQVSGGVIFLLPLPSGKAGAGVVPSPATQSESGREGARQIGILPAAGGGSDSRAEALDPDLPPVTPAPDTPEGFNG